MQYVITCTYQMQLDHEVVPPVLVRPQYSVPNQGKYPDEEIKSLFLSLFFLFQPTRFLENLCHKQIDNILLFLRLFNHLKFISFFYTRPIPSIISTIFLYFLHPTNRPNNFQPIIFVKKEIKEWLPNVFLNMQLCLILHFYACICCVYSQRVDMWHV